MQGVGKSTCISISVPPSTQPAKRAICLLVKKISFLVNKYAPVIKSCVAAIINSPFLGVTKLEIFCKFKKRKFLHNYFESILGKF